MKSFSESTVTKAVLIYLALQLLMALQPMIAAKALDPWALLSEIVAAGIMLLGNALRPDVKTGVPLLDKGNRG